MKAEFQRRQSLADALEAFVRANPNVWIPAVLFEPFGRQAWRTRLSDVRKRVEAEGGALENRLQRHPVPAGTTAYAVVSEYRYRPQALGRSAETWTAQPTRLPLYDGDVSEWQR